MRTTHPVRSAKFKHCTGRAVVKWVTISEFRLLYVFDMFLLLSVTVDWMNFILVVASSIAYLICLTR